MVNKFFEHDLENAVHILESMTEEEAAEVLKSLPIRRWMRSAEKTFSPYTVSPIDRKPLTNSPNANFLPPLSWTATTMSLVSSCVKFQRTKCFIWF